jgi:hypothetical protein
MTPPPFKKNLQWDGLDGGGAAHLPPQNRQPPALLVPLREVLWIGERLGADLPVVKSDVCPAAKLQLQKKWCVHI